jgi:hypothetical protein
LSQSNVILGALFVAWLIFVTKRNKLAKYIALLTGGGESTADKISKQEKDAEKKVSSDYTGSAEDKGADTSGGGTTIQSGALGGLGLPGIPHQYTLPGLADKFLKTVPGAGNVPLPFGLPGGS